MTHAPKQDTAAATAGVTVRGHVEVVFHSSLRFTAGRLRTDDEVVPFAGALMVRVGDAVILRGAWETHPKYGLQFNVRSFEFNQRLGRNGLAHYLATNPALKGIGPVKAARIADAFGEDFDHIIETAPGRVAREAKLTPLQLDALRDEWLRTRALNASLTWLAAFELSYHQMRTLITKFGNSVITVLEKDPYLLVREIPGFGFRRVDLVARKIGTRKDDPARIRAGVAHCVADRLDHGDCWVQFDELLTLANTLLAMDVDDSRARIEGALNELIENKTLACTSIGGQFLVAQPTMLEMEQDIAELLTTKLGVNPHLRGEDIERVAQTEGASLNDGQRQVLALAASHNMVLVSGAAGSGKTHVVAAITKLYEARDLRVVLAAPTGKAAKRLEQVVHRDAVTIHRLLGYKGRQFAHGIDDPLVADVIVIDEVSMVDVPLAWHLFRAIDFGRTCVVLVGDHHQLPPVGPGNLLHDLIERRPIPMVVLGQVVRQAGVLKENSLAILSGNVRPTAGCGPDGRWPWAVVGRFTEVGAARRYVLELFDRVLVEKLGFDLRADVQLLTPTRKGPLGVEELNVELQRVVQKKLWGVEVEPPTPGRRPALLVHDKVIQTRNNYVLGVMNGAIGVVVETGPKRGELKVRFDDHEVAYAVDTIGELSLGYALTIHKYQGSESPCVVLIVHKSHSLMHHRNLFYTGVTRARQTVIVVGDHWGISNCAQKEQVERRKTFMSVLELPRQGGTREKA